MIQQQLLCQQIKICRRAVVVTQLVERSLSTAEVRGSNPVISKLYNEHLHDSTVLKKEAGNLQHRS